jgi:hypothetical protein
VILPPCGHVVGRPHSVLFFLIISYLQKSSSSEFNPHGSVLKFSALCLTTISCFVRSDILFLLPSANSTTVGGSGPANGLYITIIESGIVPLLADLLVTNQFLYAGANIDPVSKILGRPRSFVLMKTLQDSDRILRFLSWKL